MKWKEYKRKSSRSLCSQVNQIYLWVYWWRSERSILIHSFTSALLTWRLGMRDEARESENHSKRTGSLERRLWLPLLSISIQAPCSLKDIEWTKRISWQYLLLSSFCLHPVSEHWEMDGLHPWLDTRLWGASLFLFHHPKCFPSGLTHEVGLLLDVREEEGLLFARCSLFIISWPFQVHSVWGHSKSSRKTSVNTKQNCSLFISSLLLDTRSRSKCSKIGTIQ